MGISIASRCLKLPFRGSFKRRPIRVAHRKAVEMGVRRIVPLICERCVVKFAGNNKTERWQNSCYSHASVRRLCFAKIESPVKVSELGSLFGKLNDDILPICCDEENLEISLKTLPETSADYKSVCWLRGLRAVFGNEVNLFIKMGWNTVWLGKRLFKTDTAPTCSVCDPFSSLVLIKV